MSRNVEGTIILYFCNYVYSYCSYAVDKRLESNKVLFCSVLLCSRLLDAAVETWARLGMCGPSGASLFMTRVLKIRLFDIDRFTGVDLLHVSRAFLLFFPPFSLEVLFLLLVSFLCIIAVAFFFFFFFYQFDISVLFKLFKSYDHWFNRL